MRWTSLVGIDLNGTPMSALGQKRTLTRLDPMSALPPKADIPEPGSDVR
jgi:hypothetical protein